MGGNTLVWGRSGNRRLRLLPMRPGLKCTHHYMKHVVGESEAVERADEPLDFLAVPSFHLFSTPTHE